MAVAVQRVVEIYLSTDTKLGKLDLNSSAVKKIQYRTFYQVKLLEI
ncbi:unnamed protein product [Ixodes pacificus]